MPSKTDSFEGRSSLRTYATGILKFKVIDVIRRKGREVHIEPLDEHQRAVTVDALTERGYEMLLSRVDADQLSPMQAARRRNCARWGAFVPARGGPARPATPRKSRSGL